VPFANLISGTRKLSEEAAVHCFKSVGMALFDVVTANRIVEEAEKKGLGTEIDLE
jgi:ornithine cyclodeaminase/alanine dehydrogenase-like protein (mu-crystallin family)